jgi:hypothetical protein
MPDVETHLHRRKGLAVRVHHHRLGVIVGGWVIEIGFDDPVGNLRRVSRWRGAHILLPQVEVTKNTLDHCPVVGKLGPDARGAIPDLISIMQDKDAKLVSAAVEAMGGIGHDASGTVPDLMALSRGADKRLSETIQRAIDRVKIDNQAPTVSDVKSVCQEGRTVTLSLPVNDINDVAGALVASVEQGPAHGTRSTEWKWMGNHVLRRRIRLYRKKAWNAAREQGVPVVW